jgi:hypothetical protein
MPAIRRRRALRCWAALAALAPAVAHAVPVAAPISARDAAICAHEIGAEERARRLPRELLHAIAIAESGRWDGARRARFAWPWTVTAERRGRFFATKSAAIAHVRALRARGIANIDVGCMQVNLKYHPTAFVSLERAFDPGSNVAYAAKLLASHRGTTRSWARAVSHYHTTDWHRGRAYWKRVYAIWSEERRRAFAAERKARIEAWRRRRAAGLAAR